LSPLDALAILLDSAPKNNAQGEMPEMREA